MEFTKSSAIANILKGYWQQDPEQQIQFAVGTAVEDVVDRMIAILQAAARN